MSKLSSGSGSGVVCGGLNSKVAIYVNRVLSQEASRWCVFILTSGHVANILGDEYLNQVATHRNHSHNVKNGTRIVLTPNGAPIHHSLDAGAQEM
jgi:hypothetical protein